MLNLRLRQAECATGEGRLDEACALLSEESVRGHRKGQRLVSELVQKLIARGQAHLEVGRLQAARQDCEKAGDLGGNQEVVGELRSAVVVAGEAMERSRRRAGAAVAEAKGCLDRGEYSRGAALVEGVGEAAGVGVALEAGRTARDAGVKKAQDTIERGDWDAAAGALVGIEKVAGDELLEKVRVGLENLVWADLKSGRLDRVSLRLDRLAGLGLERVRQEELDGVLDDCRLASWWVEAGDMAKAGVVLGKLKLRLEGAGWVTEAAGFVKEAEAAKAGLMCGALGLIGENKEANNGGRRIEGGEAKRLVNVTNDVEGGGNGNGGNDGGGGAKKLLLQVDGGGRCLVCRGGRVTMGAGSKFDVGLMGSGSSAGGMGAGGIVIERVEDDWFLRGQKSGGVKVNGRVVLDCLLSDGDRIEVIGCGEMKFGLPVASSVTAVLRLTGAKLARRDVRRVILMGDAVVIGSGGACHVKTDQAGGKLVVTDRGGPRSEGRLNCGVMGSGDEGRVLVAGESIEVGGVGVMISAEPRS